MTINPFSFQRNQFSCDNKKYSTNTQHDCWLPSASEISLPILTSTSSSHIKNLPRSTTKKQKVANTISSPPSSASSSSSGQLKNKNLRASSKIWCKSLPRHNPNDNGQMISRVQSVQQRMVHRKTRYYKRIRNSKGFDVIMETMTFGYKHSLQTFEFIAVNQKESNVIVSSTKKYKYLYFYAYCVSYIVQLQFIWTVYQYSNKRL